MATPPATDSGPVVELDEEVDGDEIGTRNYRFSKIGESVRINSEFDPQSLPIQALAVSERLRLLFVAHPQGFYVSRTKDVMEAAEQIKEKQSGPSLKDLSLVDVLIGKVSILALSADDSLLAASVDGHVHFFAVSALLHKDQTPSYSVSLDDSSCIKDFRWAKKAVRVYLILSDNGKLYHGSGQGPLACVMESVDSVDWSIKGKFAAVAKKNIVIILSPEFKEKLRFLLSFQSVVGGSDVNQVIKVDSIRWIRPDCIVVGCFKLNDNGEDEKYIVQVITSRGGWVTDESSKPTVLSFINVFMDFCSDAVPTRNGPHLFLSYLDLYGVAFISNRNPSQQVGLFRWSSDSEKNEVAMVDILNDAWTLNIDSQDNDEENVIVGLSVDKVSQNENVKFILGDVESEVSPCCVIICLTIDGKISVFHFASAAGALEEDASAEDDDASQVLPKHEMHLISSTGGEESKDPTFSMPESHKFIRSETEKTGAKATITNDASPSINAYIEPQEQTNAENMENKLLVYSRAANVDEPEKALPLVLNQDIDAKNQSLSEVKHSTVSFSGKVVGDFSRQLITKDPPSGFIMEPIRKVPPASSPSFGSSTGVDASKISDGRFSFLPSDVSNSDKHALESGGHLLRQPTDIKEKATTAVTSTSLGLTVSTVQGAKPAVTSTSFGLTVSTAQGPKPAVTSTSFGLTALTAQGPKPAVTSTSIGLTKSTAQGHRNSLSAYPSPQASLEGSVASGKPFRSEFRKELNSSSSARDAPKQFGTVEEMAKKLDILLEDIEGKGGFIDASITSQTKSVMELEDSIWALSGRCRTWKGLMNEQLRELQLLLDKTVQALVRKVYMEGVFKQATDTRYWELWNRQKLSSELELKQRHILELNQELTNKLIELERHFNTLEFNKFGENGGMQRNRRVLQHSRQTQSLHSLHNTMQAQLAAAEQLSGCLSNQMSALCIESSEKQDVKKKLFESIGLSYVGDAERSPAGNRISGTPLNKEHLITSSSIASKEHSRRDQASFAKSPETARRRRDSLNRSWTSFEPPKTIVKRVPKHHYDQGNANWSLNIDKQYLSPQLQKKSEFAHSARLNILLASLKSNKDRGAGETSEQHMENPLTSLHQRTADSSDNRNQMSPTKNSSALPSPSIFETRPIQNNEQAAFKLINEKTKSSLSLTGKNNTFAAGKSSFIHKQSDTSFNPLPSNSTQSPAQSPISPSVSTESSDHFKLGFTNSTTEDQKKNTSVGSETPLFDFKIPVNPAPAFSSVSKVSEKGSFTMSSEKSSRPNDNSAASSIPSQSLFGSSTLFLSNNVPSLFASSASKQSSSNSFSTPNFSLSSFHESNVSSISPSSGIMKPEESLTSLSHPPVDNTPTNTSVNNTLPKTEKDGKIQASPSQSTLAISTPDLKLGPSTSSVLTELSSNLKLGSQAGIGVLSKSSSVASVSKTDLSQVTQSSEGVIGSLKNVISNSSQEEEMDEEAPETDQTSGLSLGNLGGFGIGSTPNSTAPKPNPFGVTNLNNNPAFASMPNMMSTPSSGELFRPASFNFLSPESPQPLQPTAVNFTGGFSSGNSGQAASGFGQPAHIGAGQQALGSVLGSFGQSRQIGTGLPGSNVAPASAFGGGLRGASPGGYGGGFASAAPSAGGFASLAAGGGGFGSSAVAGGGFAAAANAGGGFAAAANAGGGFAAAATGGGGFAAAATGISGFGAAAATGVSGFGAAAATGGGGFGAAAATGGGGFGAAATGGGGFGAAATGGGGFGSAATGGGGFGAAATSGGGFGVATPTVGVPGSNPGGGFGAFGNQQGGGGFSGFVGGSGVARPPRELFTQMRK